jgi:hypothetical protein
VPVSGGESTKSAVNASFVSFAVKAFPIRANPRLSALICAVNFVFPITRPVPARRGSSDHARSPDLPHQLQAVSQRRSAVLQKVPQLICLGGQSAMQALKVFMHCC